MHNQKVVIPITKDDIEMFRDLIYQSNNRFSWTFPTDKGQSIDIHFTDEYCEKCMDTDDLELCPVENILYCKECLEEENEEEIHRT